MNPPPTYWINVYQASSGEQGLGFFCPMPCSGTLNEALSALEQKLTRVGRWRVTPKNPTRDLTGKSPEML